MHNYQSQLSSHIAVSIFQENFNIASFLMNLMDLVFLADKVEVKNLPDECYHHNYLNDTGRRITNGGTNNGRVIQF